MNITEIVIEKIRTNGPISFREFMNIALYEPDKGYYVNTRENIGLEGDYYTSPHLSSLFAAMLSRQIEEMWLRMDKSPFHIVEMGGGNGELARQILAQLSSNQELFGELKYTIIEKKLRSNDITVSGKKINWVKSIDELGSIQGCVLSNELIDNLPTHVIVMQDQPMEVFVDYQNGFVELLLPADRNIIGYLALYSNILTYGYRTEVNLDAIELMMQIANKLTKGFVLTIDYGYTSSEYYDPARSRGTLNCFYKHSVNHEPYEHIGMQDITSHVNFSALAYTGIQSGLAICGYAEQSRFLSGLGITGYIRNLEALPNYTTLNGEQMQKLLHTLMIDMGTKFKMLIQQKGLDQPWLSGLAFKQHLDLPAKNNG